MSPELQAPLRTRQEAARDILVNLLRRETYIVFGETDGRPVHYDFELGLTRGAVVYDIATGEHDWRIDHQQTGPIAVIRIGIGEPAEDVTESIARDVLRYRIKHDLTHDDEGYLRPCPFLDVAWPEWESEVRPGRVDPPELERV